MRPDVATTQGAGMCDKGWVTCESCPQFCSQEHSWGDTWVVFMFGWICGVSSSKDLGGLQPCQGSLGGGGGGYPCTPAGPLTVAVFVEFVV